MRRTYTICELRQGFRESALKQKPTPNCGRRRPSKRGVLIVLKRSPTRTVKFTRNDVNDAASPWEGCVACEHTFQSTVDRVSGATLCVSAKLPCSLASVIQVLDPLNVFAWVWICFAWLVARHSVGRACTQVTLNSEKNVVCYIVVRCFGRFFARVQQYSNCVDLVLVFFFLLGIRIV